MERLIELRKARHLTQKQVAEGANTTEVAVQNYESGSESRTTILSSPPPASSM